MYACNLYTRGEIILFSYRSLVSFLDIYPNLLNYTRTHRTKTIPIFGLLADEHLREIAKNK